METDRVDGTELPEPPEAGSDERMDPEILARLQAARPDDDED